MSYNITRFALRSVSLNLPLSFSIEDFYNRYRPNNSWYTEPFKVDLEEKKWKWQDNCEGFSMSGNIEDNNFVVNEVNCTGEGSGSEYYSILLPLFSYYHGNLDCVIVWEGGDEIIKLSIQNGTVREEDLDLMQV